MGPSITLLNYASFSMSSADSGNENSKPLHFRFKRVLCFVIQDACISRLLRDGAFSWRPGKLLCGLKTLRIFGDFAI